jgi:hypothetical protein
MISQGFFNVCFFYLLSLINNFFQKNILKSIFNFFHFFKRIRNEKKKIDFFLSLNYSH